MATARSAHWLDIHGEGCICSFDETRSYVLAGLIILCKQLIINVLPTIEQDL